MPSFNFTYSSWLNYHKVFGVIAIVIENNRIHCQTYCLTIEYCSPDQELYVINFSTLIQIINGDFRGYCN